MRPSTAISLLALFLALTGGAYAAVKLPSNSVGSKQIKRNAVTLTKIAPAAKKALKGAVGPAGVPGAPGAAGQAGSKGEQGIQGPEGPVAKADAAGNIDIATNPETGDTNTIRIGSATQQRVLVPAVANDGTGGMVGVELDTSTGRLTWAAASSRRLKRDIHPLQFSTERFMRLQPVRFRYRRGDIGVRYGLIAEDVAKLFPQITVFNKAHRPIALQMDELPTMLLVQVQRQQRQIDSLEQRIARLERR